MPKINLLPQERSESAARRRGLAIGLFVALVYVAALGLIFFTVKGREATAEDDLARQLQANQLLQAEIVELEPYAQLRSQYENGVGQVQEALALDVAWGRVLGDFGRMIPQGVWLESLAIQAVAPADVEGEDASTPAFGMITMSGQGFEVANVASWLVALDSRDWEDVGAAWVSTITKSEPTDGGVPATVSWAITGVLDEASLTDRAETLVPEVPE